MHLIFYIDQLQNCFVEKEQQYFLKISICPFISAATLQLEYQADFNYMMIKNINIIRLCF